jgi:hypothetical protein
MNARDLSNHLASLLRKEREAMADFLLALANFDDKKLWRDLGHTSLFYYLRRELGLSAGAAQHRKTAVELIQQFPVVETALRQGRLCLSSVCELGKVVTPENVAEVLPRFVGLSRREAEAVAASIRPAAAFPQREVVTPVRATALAPSAEVRREIAPPEPMVTEVHPGELPSRMDLVLPPPAATAPARPPDRAQPLTAELSRFHITVSRQFIGWASGNQGRGRGRGRGRDRSRGRGRGHAAQRTPPARYLFACAGAREAAASPCSRRKSRTTGNTTSGAFRPRMRSVWPYSRPNDEYRLGPPQARKAASTTGGGARPSFSAETKSAGWTQAARRAR